MTSIPKPIQIMETLVTYINDAYMVNAINIDGIIQLHLIHKEITENYFIHVTKDRLSLHEGINDDPSVILRTTLYHFLDLASGKLNPILGVLLRKLKFSGNISFFKKVMQQENMFIAGTNWKNYTDPIDKFEKNPFNPWLKPKSVLIINGSPRGKKGYTDFYLQPFKQGLKAAGADVEIVYLNNHKINDCKGCLICMMGSSGACIHDGKDQFESIYEKQSKADLIVFAFPLYLDGLPGLLKNYLDRTVRSDYAFKIEGPNKLRHTRRNIKNQTMMAFSICGYLENKNFNAVKEHFKQLSDTKHMPLISGVYRSASIYLYNNPLVFQKLNIVMNALKNAGEEVIFNGKIGRATKKRIEMDVDKPSTFLKIANSFFFKKMANNEKKF